MQDLFNPDILLIGSCHMKRIARPSRKLIPGQINPGSVKITPGGMTISIAIALSKLNLSVALSFIRGKDDDGQWLENALKEENLDLSLSLSSPSSTTATCTAIMDERKTLLAAIEDSAIYETYPASGIKSCLHALPNEAFLLADTTLPGEILRYLTENKDGNTFILCATDGPKAIRAREFFPDADLLVCCESEAAILAEEYADPAALPEILRENGVDAGLIVRKNSAITAWNPEEIWSYPAPPIRQKITHDPSPTIFASTLYGLIHEMGFEQSLKYGHAGANLAVMSEQSVPDFLTPPALEACLEDE